MPAAHPCGAECESINAAFDAPTGEFKARQTVESNIALCSRRSTRRRTTSPGTEKNRTIKAVQVTWVDGVCERVVIIGGVAGLPAKVR